MSSWRPDSPVELADGSLCCNAHHLVCCGVCCVDYSFMQEGSDTDEEVYSNDEEDDQARIIFARSDDRLRLNADTPPRLNQAAHPFNYRPVQNQRIPVPIENIARFIPPQEADTPKALFAGRHRFIRRSNPHQILIYTDGACPNNGRAVATTGCAFAFRPPSTVASIDGTVSFPLEVEGPSGAVYAPTSNRAELRAVIAALQYRDWPSEGWTELLIVIDSEYVVLGATAWVRGWLRNG